MDQAQVYTSEAEKREIDQVRNELRYMQTQHQQLKRDFEQKASSSTQVFNLHIGKQQ
jgi:hypothetical protein